MLTDLWINNKTKKIYEVIGNAIDATNSRDFNEVVVYRDVEDLNKWFIRDLPEFIEKFTKFTK